jgi:BCD family chlorophyll transporter-like MFS transporter
MSTVDTAAVNPFADARSDATGLSWFGIVRLGLIQTALGAIVVLTTSTLNRVMVVELGLLAMLPGALVGWHYAIQMLRPRWGYGSDVGGRRTPWIIGGMAILGLGGALAAVATALMATSFAVGFILAAIAFTLIGIGVGACGTSLLTLLATTVAGHRRAAAASTVWIMMIAGFVVTAISVGTLLEPFSFWKLVTVASGVSVVAFLVTVVAVWGIEAQSERTGAIARRVAGDSGEAEEKPDFKAALREVWSETQARRFTVFVFVSMLAYSMQDLILEPFAGLVFGMTPGESTKLAGVQHGGVLVGMLLVAIAGSLSGGSKVGALRVWAICGCVASMVSLFALASSIAFAPNWPLKTSVFLLGLSNGAFAVAAIGSMMGLAVSGRGKREGTRMGLWGAAQAIAFGLGGLLGAILVDLSTGLLGQPDAAYAAVFTIEALLFGLAAWLAARIGATAADQSRVHAPLAAEPLMEMENR